VARSSPYSSCAAPGAFGLVVAPVRVDLDHRLHLSDVQELRALGGRDRTERNDDGAALDQREQAGAGLRGVGALERDDLARGHLVAVEEAAPVVDEAQQLGVAVGTALEDDGLGVAKGFQPVQKRMGHRFLPLFVRIALRHCPVRIVRGVNFLALFR